MSSVHDDTQAVIQMMRYGTNNTSREVTVDLADINAQAQDISFLIGYAQTLPDMEMSEIAVAGFSSGGISNLFAAASRQRLDSG